MRQRAKRHATARTSERDLHADTVSDAEAGLHADAVSDAAAGLHADAAPGLHADTMPDSQDGLHSSAETRADTLLHGALLFAPLLRVPFFHIDSPINRPDLQAGEHSSAEVQRNAFHAEDCAVSGYAQIHAGLHDRAEISTDLRAGPPDSDIAAVASVVLSKRPTVYGAAHVPRESGGCTRQLQRGDAIGFHVSPHTAGGEWVSYLQCGLPGLSSVNRASQQLSDAAAQHVPPLMLSKGLHVKPSRVDTTTASVNRLTAVRWQRWRPRSDRSLQ